MIFISLPSSHFCSINTNHWRELQVFLEYGCRISFFISIKVKYKNELFNLHYSARSNPYITLFLFLNYLLLLLFCSTVYYTIIYKTSMLLKICECSYHNNKFKSMDLLCLNDYVDQLSLSQCQNHKTLHTMFCHIQNKSIRI